jgi:hypothetical protein
VNLAESGDCGVGGALDGDWIGNIADDSAGLRSKARKARQRVVERGFLDISEHDFAARPGKGAAERQADAASAASHKSGSAEEFAHLPAP